MTEDPEIRKDIERRVDVLHERREAAVVRSAELIDELALLVRDAVNAEAETRTRLYQLGIAPGYVDVRQRLTDRLFASLEALWPYVPVVTARKESE
jgi:hypothetical protein